MSYILDALKESQRSRDEQPVPNIGSVQVSPELETNPEKTSKGLLIGLVSLIVLLGAGGGWWFAGQDDEGPSTPAQPIYSNEVKAPKVQEARIDAAAVDQEATTLEVSEPKKVSVVNKPAVIDELPEAGEPVVENSEAILDDLSAAEPVSELNTAVAALDMGSSPLTSPSQEPINDAIAGTPVEREDVARLELQPEAQPEVQPMVNEVKPDPPVAEADPLSDAAKPVSNIVDESPAPTVLPTEEVSKAETAPPVVEPERVPHYRELPFDIRQEVEGVKFSVHLYSPNPARRLVKINGIVHREGSEVSPGLVLDEVTQKGAIFTYRNYRFGVPVQ